MSSLTHFNASGDAHMVDVSDKAVTRRVAIAEGYIEMLPATLQLIEQGNHKKGDVLGIARVAGIMAAKKTSDLIPLCHPIGLTHVDVQLESNGENRVLCQITTETSGVTGVEMEALSAVSVCLLTIYDMCKAVDRAMEIGGIRLLKKSGGKTGEWVRE